jgi:hypothetical protein
VQSNQKEKKLQSGSDVELIEKVSKINGQPGTEEA